MRTVPVLLLPKYQALKNIAQGGCFCILSVVSSIQNSYNNWVEIPLTLDIFAVGWKIPSLGVSGVACEGMIDCRD